MTLRSVVPLLLFTQVFRQCPDECITIKICCYISSRVAEFLQDTRMWFAISTTLQTHQVAYKELKRVGNLDFKCIVATSVLHLRENTATCSDY